MEETSRLGSPFRGAGGGWGRSPDSRIGPVLGDVDHAPQQPRELIALSHCQAGEDRAEVLTASVRDLAGRRLARRREQVAHLAAVLRSISALDEATSNELLHLLTNTAGGHFEHLSQLAHADTGLLTDAKEDAELRQRQAALLPDAQAHAVHQPR